MIGRWWTRARGVLGEALREVAALEIPSPPSPPWTPPPFAVGDQLRSPQERQRRLREHARRQEQERREEQEQRRLGAEELRREVERQPLGALFPWAPSPWLTGDELVGRLMGNNWRP